MTDRLSALPATLDAFRSGQLPLTELTRTWRDAAQGHQPALPQRGLNQLESAALFTEESCSFSQGDMVDALSDWLTRARAL